MKISVCIPTFTAAAYIRVCLESVFSQEDVEFEIIVFDNASQDATWDIIQSLSDPRIRAFRSDRNCGMAANFNRALQAASGDYIKLLCADDLLEPGALKSQADFLDTHPETVLVTSATRLIDAQNRVLDEIKWFSRPVEISRVKLRSLSLIYGNVVGEPSAVLFRREAWLRAGHFREGLATLIDLDMWVRMSRYGFVSYLPLPLVRIRRHALSMTNQLRKAGDVQNAVLQFTESLLIECQAHNFIRKICLGKVAGSHLRHAFYGIKRGLLKWPAVSIALAFGIDPFFIGLFLYLVLFRSGIVRLQVDYTGKSFICATGTLSCLPEVQ